MRTRKETEAEALRRATQAMTAAGWGTFPIALAGTHMEGRYWEDWNEAYDEAMLDLENENEE